MDEGSTVLSSDTKMRFSPVLSSREAKKSDPAGNGKNVRAIPVDTTVGSNGTLIAVELTGIIDKKAGIVLRLDPAKEIMTGLHCSTSAVKLNLRAWTKTTCVSNARTRRSRPAMSSIGQPQGANTGLARKNEKKGRGKGERVDDQDCGYHSF